MKLPNPLLNFVRKWNKPSKDAHKMEVPADQVDALLSLREEYNDNPTMKNALKLSKFAHQICPELANWDGAEWNLHVLGGKLWFVEDV